MVVVVPDQGAGGNPVLCRYVPKRLPGDEGLVDLVALPVGADGAAPGHGLGHVARDDSQDAAREAHAGASALPEAPSGACGPF